MPCEGRVPSWVICVTSHSCQVVPDNLPLKDQSDSLPGRAKTLISEGMEPAIFPHLLSAHLGVHHILKCWLCKFWQGLPDSVQGGQISEAFGKIHVNILHYSVTVQGLPRLRLFQVSLSRRKIKAEGNSQHRRYKGQSWAPLPFHRLPASIVLLSVCCVVVGFLWEYSVFRLPSYFHFLVFLITFMRSFPPLCRKVECTWSGKHRKAPRNRTLP